MQAPWGSALPGTSEASQTIPAEQACKQTICLSMIVRNEAHVIRRCLRSVLPWITHWVISDTGSTDGTQDVIRAFMAESGVPGEVVDRPWVDFSHNRNEALIQATPQAEYLLVIDADEYLESDAEFVMPPLAADAYSLQLISGPYTYPKLQLFRADAGWRYVHAMHECAVLPRHFTHAVLPGLRTIRIMDGARSRDPLTYRRDALLLEQMLLQEPGNARSMFYLAQSYADAGEPALAIDRYQRRIAMGGWDEEVWCSKYQIAKLLPRQGAPWPEVQQAYLETYALRPTRAEPLFHVGAHFQARQEFAIAHLFFAQAIQIPYPAGEMLAVEQDVYRFVLPLEYAVSCFYMGRHEDAIRTANRLLASDGLTAERIEQIIRNRQFSLDALFPPRAETSSALPAGQRRACLFAIVMAAHDVAGMNEWVRLLHAQSVPCRALFLERATENGSAMGALAAAAGFEHRLVPEQASWGDCLGVAREAARAGEIVVPLPSTTQPADTRCAEEVLEHFDRYPCTILYSQFLRSDGTMGNTLPFASSADLEHTAAALQFLAITAEFLHSGLPRSVDSQLTLLRAAGYSRIRFTDRPFVVVKKATAKATMHNA